MVLGVQNDLMRDGGLKNDQSLPIELFKRFDWRDLAPFLRPFGFWDQIWFQSQVLMVNYQWYDQK